MSLAPTTYVPSFPGICLDPRISFEQISLIIKNNELQMDKILDYLSTTDEQAVAEVKEKKSSSSCSKTFSCCKISCENSLTNLISYMATNAFQIVKDTFSCFPCCSSKDSDKKLWVTREFDRTISESRVNYHRNLCGLCCIAPTAIVVTPFMTSPAIVLAFGILSNLTTVTTAGIMTYVFSGDFGIQKVDGQNVLAGGIRLDAANRMMNGFQEISRHLMSKWNRRTAETQPILFAQCQGILKNWDEIRLSMSAKGLSDSTIDGILAPFSDCLIRIRRDVELHQPHRVNFHVDSVSDHLPSEEELMLLSKRV